MTDASKCTCQVEVTDEELYTSLDNVLSDYCGKPGRTHSGTANSPKAFRLPS